jgi:hypothetical protein
LTTIETFRRRPELIVGPCLVFWLLANCLPIAFGQPFILGVLRIAAFHNPPGNAFPVTYGIAIFLFFFTVFALKPLNWPRRILVAFAVPFAFTHLYEVSYELIAYFVWYPLYDWALWPLTLFLNATWLVLGISTLPFWRLKWRSGGIALVAFLLAFAAWWLFFLPFIAPVHYPTNPEGSGYIVSHALLGVVIACLIWDGRLPRVSSKGDPPSKESSCPRQDRRRVAETDLGNASTGSRALVGFPRSVRRGGSTPREAESQVLARRDRGAGLSWKAL